MGWTIRRDGSLHVATEGEGRRERVLLVGLRELERRRTNRSERDGGAPDDEGRDQEE